MSKRPLVDLSALTADIAMPMPDATQRSVAPPPVTTAPTPPPAPPIPPAAAVEKTAPVTPAAPAPATTTPVPKASGASKSKATPEPVKSTEFVSLSFKVPPAFRRHFRKCAHELEMQLNELLFEALEAWEERRKRKH